MPRLHYTILGRQFCEDRRQKPEIVGNSELAPVSVERNVWVIKDEIWQKHWCFADVREVPSMLNTWTCMRFQIA